MRRSIVEIPLPYFRHIFSNGCRYVRAHCVSCPALWALLHHHGGRDAHAARGVCGDRHALVADAPLVLIAGVFTLFGGLAIVLLHNYWSGGALTVIITLLGWLTLIKAVLLLVLPSTRLVALYGGVSPTYIVISGSLTLLLGIYLTVAGFRSPP